MATASTAQPEHALTLRGAERRFFSFWPSSPSSGLRPSSTACDSGLGVTRLGSVVPWGLWVAFYIFFIGLSAGSFLLSTLVFVFRNKTLEPVGRLAVLQAFVCLLTGLVFILIDLGHWERFWHVIVYPQWNSVLAWEIWFYNFYIVLLLAELWLLMRRDLARWAGEVRGVRRLCYRVLSLGFRCPDDRGRRAGLRRHGPPLAHASWA